LKNEKKEETKLKKARKKARDAIKKSEETKKIENMES